MEKVKIECRFKRLEFLRRGRQTRQTTFPGLTCKGKPIMSIGLME